MKLENINAKRLKKELTSTTNISHVSLRQNYNVCKGLAKLGNIVAKTSLQMQMFPSLAARETYVAEAYFAS